MKKKYASIILNKGKEQSVKRYHPWIFSGAINKMDNPVSEGEVVKVYSSSNEFLGIGHYQIGSIAVRIFSFKEIESDSDFWKNKIIKAVELRQKIGLFNNSETNVFRLINAEGDGMPGLIVDFYNGVVVMQAHSVGMFLIREKLAELFKEILGEKLVAIYDKSEKTLPQKAGLHPVDGFIFGSLKDVVVSEYGLKFSVDFVSGQKTGFFIDQRENRKLVESYSAGCDVLNMFCYTGGFSAYALRGGANLVHSVDSSTKVVNQTKENIELNFPGDNRHQTFEADAFEFLKNINGKYDLIILDPPAFAKHRNTLPQALQGYKRINTRAFEQIRPGGILFTFSCSQIVPRDKFREAVFTAAAIAGRTVKILHQLTHPADHPVDIFHPEGEYLKGLVLFVE
jgi:23S rRNA (cytosine1962-C5)-methyltransferase